MQRFSGSLIVLGAVVGFTVAAEVPEEAPSRGGTKASANPPTAIFQHTTMQGHAGKFELNGEKGKADYHYNGEHRQDDLVFTRSAEVSIPPSAGGMAGWVYQVSRAGKKEPLWFFFARNPVQPNGETYAMFYSTTPPGKDGKQMWTRILAPGGTKRSTLDMEPKASEL
jgi:hypothetical protein